jgi:propionate CoA-transferase
MNFLTKAALLAHIARWRFNWYRFNTHYPAPPGCSGKFLSPIDAAGLIRDGDFIAVSGLGSSQWVSILYHAICERFAKTGHPAGITAMAIGGMGGRGKVPGSIDELARDGLCTRFFTGHAETFKNVLRLTDEGKIELQCLPQGALAFLLEAQARGEESLLTATGVGTHVDPRTGNGTPVANPGGRQYVAVENDKLRFTIPKVTVGMFNAPAADRDGNIYIKNCAMIAESGMVANAARANGGKVIVLAGQLVEKGYDEIFLRGDRVDAVVVYPGAEQVGSVHHRRYWPMFTTKSNLPIREGIARLKFANQTLNITPRRSAVDDALARLAATVFTETTGPGSLVSVGLPEEVVRLIFKAGLVDQITLFTESGVIGGLPAPGVFFGAAVCPKKMTSSAEVFRMCYDRLDTSILGVLQADSEGNVNVSKRGKGAINYVGPGGFIDFTTAARTVVFVTSWMVRAKLAIDGGKLKLIERGKPKFVEKVDEITFNGKRALATGKNIYYVTNVGVFKLTTRGMEIIRIMPGIDLQKDILDASPMRILIPESGPPKPVDTSIITGKDFKLQLT